MTENTNQKKKKILVIEDQKTISNLYKIKFENAGCEVMTAANGIEAIVIVPDFKPDVILLDIMMPVMDGFETLRVLRDLAPSIVTKIIVFSNLDKPSDIERAYSLWADDYILKVDVTPKEVFERIMKDCGDSDTSESSGLLPEEAGGTEMIQNFPLKTDRFWYGTFQCPHCKKPTSVIVEWWD